MTDTPNAASRGVAEKPDFTDRGRATVYGSDEMVLYRLTRETVVGREVA